MQRPSLGRIRSSSLAFNGKGTQMLGSKTETDGLRVSDVAEGWLNMLWKCCNRPYPEWYFLLLGSSYICGFLAGQISSWHD